MDYDIFLDMISESLGVERKFINDDTSFLNDIGIDSLTLSNFIIRLERKYNIQIDITNVWDLKNVKDAYELFQNAINNSNKKAMKYL